MASVLTSANGMASHFKDSNMAATAAGNKPSNELKEHVYWMSEAFKMAKYAMSHREVPVGCVVVEEGVIVAKGCNEVNITMNATRHAEMVAIDQLVHLSKERSVQLKELCSKCTLYVTVEPCVMCAYALRVVGLLHVFFGCSNSRFGGCGSVMSVATDELSTTGSHYGSHGNTNGQIPELVLTSGIMKDEAISMLQQFYEGENPNAPEDKVKRKPANKKLK